ncbi:hypothetical protein VE02_04216 [Pseudogymnoascus sp. 03VT05]|nr:hypothetical protein VE02_04216 [Pseudogymnoascus sp. 03VT05]
MPPHIIDLSLTLTFKALFQTEKDIAIQRTVSDNGEPYTSKISAVRVGRENLSNALPPHEDYEGLHRFDPGATWTPAEEKRVILKTDLYLLSWICVMFAGLQLDRGNLSNATADNILDDLNLTSDDYNNGTTIQLLAFMSFFYLPSSPTSTSGVIWRKPWYTEREEIIMINRILRDDPAKGLKALKEPATFADIKRAWSDKSMWGLYFVGLVAYIPATLVQAYLTLTRKRLNFTTFNSNMLTVPSAVIQIITMLTLSYSSEFFNERTFHCFFGEFWILPLLVALLTLPDGGREWSRFSLITLISGYPYFHPIVSAWISENTFDVKKRAITAATYNVIVQVESLIGSQIYRKYDSPYYKQGNKVLISICALSLLTFVAQRLYLQNLNKRKATIWDEMTDEERSIYQADATATEADGNKRLDFRFQY